VRQLPSQRWLWFRLNEPRSSSSLRRHMWRDRRRVVRRSLAKAEAVGVGCGKQTPRSRSGGDSAIAAREHFDAPRPTLLAPRMRSA
jgi:hypothetical protein